jgi:hypothetical protein
MDLLFVMMKTYHFALNEYAEEGRVVVQVNRNTSGLEKQAHAQNLHTFSDMKNCTKTLITNKCRKRGLSSIVTHSYMFRPCWIIFRENLFVIVTLRLHFTVE